MDLDDLYGFYVTMSGFANSTGVRLEEGFEGYAEDLKALRADHRPAERRGPAQLIQARWRQADYSAPSRVQLEQTNRMGRRGLPSTSKLQKGMINYPRLPQGHLAASALGAIDKTLPLPRIWQLACMRTVCVRQRISVVAALQGHPEPGRDG